MTVWGVLLVSASARGPDDRESCVLCKAVTVNNVQVLVIVKPYCHCQEGGMMTASGHHIVKQSCHCQEGGVMTILSFYIES